MCLTLSQIIYFIEKIVFNNIITRIIIINADNIISIIIVNGPQTRRTNINIIYE